MMELKENFGDILSAISLLLAIISVVYGVWFPEIKEGQALQDKLKDPANVANYKNKYLALLDPLINKLNVLFWVSLIVFVLYLIPSLHILLGFLNYLASYEHKDIFHYDAVQASVLIFELFAIWFCTHLSDQRNQLIQIQNKIRQGN